jgi:hypothetical protein
METSAMSEQITWTHVDRYVRDAHDKRGMLPMGPTDADCTLSYIKWLERMLDTQSTNGDRTVEELRRTRVELERVKANSRPLKKSKQRIADLEENVEILRRHLGLEL